MQGAGTVGPAPQHGPISRDRPGPARTGPAVTPHQVRRCAPTVAVSLNGKTHLPADGQQSTPADGSTGGSGPSFTGGNDGGALADTGSTAPRHGLLAAALVTAGAATTYAARRRVNH
ncbi:hypothetical protein ACWHA1_25170 [Streptomyces decoyicus]